MLKDAMQMGLWVAVVMIMLAIKPGDPNATPLWMASAIAVFCTVMASTENDHPKLRVVEVGLSAATIGVCWGSAQPMIGVVFAGFLALWNASEFVERIKKPLKTVPPPAQPAAPGTPAPGQPGAPAPVAAQPAAPSH
jgi:hypothetical protein